METGNQDFPEMLFRSYTVHLMIVLDGACLQRLTVVVFFNPATLMVPFVAGKFLIFLTIKQ